ncbi:MAG: outer membrane beta-barrel protein [Ginsengibacter sp.]
MLDDEYDKKIKEAAEHYHPAYDDTAWEKMEQLLDEHLPQKKERRKIFFILPSLLLVAALVFFVVMNNGKKDSSNIAQNVSSKNNTEKTLVEKPVLDSKEKKLPTSGESTKNSLLPKQTEAKNDHQSISVSIQKANKTASNSFDQNKKEASVLNSDVAAKENELKQQPVSNTNKNDENNKAISPAEVKNSTSNNDSKQVISDENNSAPNKLVGEEKVAKNEKEKTTPAIKKSKKTNNSFSDNFGVSISAGPDISGVHANKIGKLTAVFGAGLQYSISKHFSIRSGFYVSKKIYSVEGDDYNLPGGNPNYAYLENVSANCTVYEIPVKADYHFNRIKNHTWFISTGLSSYLMKKESYDYYYKTVSGEIYEKDWTINNKNKHFFSVLSFSGGYEYFFNKQFSFAAEPYINLPLKGIGVGKVKLNSGGILFTLKMKPFIKGK